MEEYFKYFERFAVEELLTDEAGSPGETTRVFCTEYLKLKALSFNDIEAFDRIFEVRLYQMKELIPEIIEIEDISLIKEIIQNNIPALVLFDFLISRGFRIKENRQIIENNLSLIFDIIIKEYQKFKIDDTIKESHKMKLRKSYIDLCKLNQTNKFSKEITKNKNEEIYSFNQPSSFDKLTHNSINEFKINITSLYFEINSFRINLKDIASINIKDNCTDYRRIMYHSYSFEFIDFKNIPHRHTHTIYKTGISSQINDTFAPYYKDFLEFINNEVYNLLFHNYLERISGNSFNVGPFKIDLLGVLLIQNYIITKREKLVNWKNIKFEKHLGKYGYRLSDINAINTSLSTFEISEWQFRVLKDLGEKLSAT